MKVNPTVALTLILLALMAGSGVVSGSWGYKLGREALRGITQPDARPGSNVSGSPSDEAPQREGFSLFNEADILNDVKVRMEGGTLAEPSGNAQPIPTPEVAPEESATEPASDAAFVEITPSAETPSSEVEWVEQSDPAPDAWADAPVAADDAPIASDPEIESPEEPPATVQAQPLEIPELFQQGNSVAADSPYAPVYNESYVDETGSPEADSSAWSSGSE